MIDKGLDFGWIAKYLRRCLIEGVIVTEPEKQARIFKVLSVDTRIKIIELLKRQSLCVNALARILGITPAAVSQHLRVLRDCDIVIADKQGYFVHYRVNSEILAEWSKITKSILEVTN